MLTGPGLGVGFGGGCEGAIQDGAGREGVVAVSTVAETPEGRYPRLTAELTGALTLCGTHRTVGSFFIEVRVDARLGLRRWGKKVRLMEVPA